MQAKIEKINNGFLYEDEGGKTHTDNLQSLLTELTYANIKKELETHAIKLTVLVEIIEDDAAPVDQNTAESGNEIVGNFTNLHILYLKGKNWVLYEEGDTIIRARSNGEVIMRGTKLSVLNWLTDRIWAERGMKRECIAPDAPDGIVEIFLDSKMWKVVTDSNGASVIVDSLNREVKSGGDIDEWIKKRIVYEKFTDSLELDHLSKQFLAHKSWTLSEKSKGFYVILNDENDELICGDKASVIEAVKSQVKIDDFTEKHKTSDIFGTANSIAVLMRENNLTISSRQCDQMLLNDEDGNVIHEGTKAETRAYIARHYGIRGRD